MKKSVVTGVRKAELVEVPDPQPKGDWVVVRVDVAPMCTEYKQFLSGYEGGMMGHEAAGEVVAVAQPGRVQVGDRVVAMPLAGCGCCTLCVSGDYIHCEHAPNYAATHGTTAGSDTMSQYILKQDWLLPKIPDGVSTEHASLACCALGPSFGAFDLMGLDAFDTVLITGAGPVGLGAVVNAAFRGARVFVVEGYPYRAARAKELGAEVVLDPRQADIVAQVKDLTEGRGVDKALDCSGVPQAQRLCIDATRRKGSVAFVGECQDDLSIKVSPDMIRKGLKLIGSWHYNLALFPRLMQVIQNSPVIERLVSHEIPMSRIQEAMELSASHECAKILLKPWQ
ncbi:MAG TPA: zinc-binding dehydrogenase [Chthonomonadaceae bacterium]|nr:zinc-binding dehydrogenase [Chthonomonadaceae bacterium]